MSITTADGSSLPPSTSTSTPKRARPPTLAIQSSKPLPLNLPTSRPFSALDSEDDSLRSEFALLESLRQNVRKNLALRPLTAPSSSEEDDESDVPASSTSTVFSYHTAPTSPEGGSSPSSTRLSISPPSPISLSLDHGLLNTIDGHGLGTALDGRTSNIPNINGPILASAPDQYYPTSSSHPATRAIDPPALAAFIASPFSSPLILDTRPAVLFSVSRIIGSVNVSIPTLILKRCRKPTGAFTSMDALKPFITTDECRSNWDALMNGTAGGKPRWSGDVVVLDEEMDEADPLAPSETHFSPRASSSTAAWTLLHALSPTSGIPGLHSIVFLRGGISAARYAPETRSYMTGDPTDMDIDMDAGTDSYGAHFVLDAYHASSPIGTTGSGSGPGFGLGFGLGITVPSPPPPPPSNPNLEKKQGLFLLRTSPPPRPHIPRSSSLGRPSSSSSSSSSSASPSYDPEFGGGKYDLTPSPSPSIASFPRSPRPSSTSPNSSTGPPRPKLRRLDTTSSERLTPPPSHLHSNKVAGGKGSSGSAPRLHLKTMPVKSATLGGPSSGSHLVPAGLKKPGLGRLQLPPPLSPSGMHSSHKSRGDIVISSSPATPSPSSEIPDPSYPNSNSKATTANTSSTPSSPHTPLPPSPSTARPSPISPPSHQNTLLSATSTHSTTSTNTPSSALAPFSISTILPNFLFLGPEPTSPTHVAELKTLGVKRVLNIAVECEDELGLKDVFERYLKIPMRDNVEEEGVGRGVREVCQFLDDARLHSSPTFVHCKAGKSRSVTAVMAYLIHANHWPLSRAYAFVLERRKGISPNIGFVSELMAFEEEELGGKSIGVRGGDGGAGGADQSDVSNSSSTTSRRAAHVRESLPPAFQQTASFSGAHGTGGGDDEHGVGQEMEVKDSEGRYRHARRAPVDETTLQPGRRVSKAGLETWA